MAEIASLGWPVSPKAPGPPPSPPTACSRAPPGRRDQVAPDGFWSNSSMQRHLV